MKTVKIQGFYRWLLTYLPVFFIIISALILIFYLAISSYSKKQTVVANTLFAENVLQAVDSSFQFTEQMIIKELITDEKLRMFYNEGQQLTPFEYYEISRRLKDITTAFPPIKSIYLYRVTDNLVLTTNTMVPLDDFEDRAFLNQSMSQPMDYAWTNSRDYQEFEGLGHKMNVVSLAKKVPLGSGSKGMLVVNVSTGSFKEMFSHLSEMNVYINLSDSNDHLLFGETVPSNKQLSEVTSAYTGWKIQSGMKNKKSFDLIATLSNIWVILGMLTVAVGTWGMVYIIRRNYKPIESIQNRIQLYASQKNSLLANKPTGDEFHFISSSIENLIEISNSYEQSYKENLMFRKRRFFDDLIEGERPIDLEEWQLEMRRLGLSNQFERFAIAVLEIDQYVEFCSDYSHSDQQLLKFAVSCVMKEISLNQSIYIWNEWVSSHQIGILFTLTKDNEDKRVTVYKFCEAIRYWIAENLKFTVSFGIGGTVHSILEASQSYHTALEALQYKTTFGINKTIGHWEIDMLPQGQIYRHLPDIRLMAQYYRLGEAEWKEYLHQLFMKLRTVISPRDEIISLMNYVIFTIHKEMTALPAEMNALWEQHALHPLNQLLSRFDVLEHMESRFIGILEDAEGKIRLLRENRDNHQLIRGVRQYIAEHYANQELSLNHLSDEFQMNIKSLSRIFKEEFGENFVDYLTKVRIEHAKRMLVEMYDEPLREIAQRVGYAHSISFIRVFKKIEGVTPGDYRKSLVS